MNKKADPLDVRLQVRVPQPTAQGLAQLAEHYGVSVSHVARQALQAWLALQNKGVPRA